MQKSRLGIVRPTTSKVLESLMATLAPDLEGARVLDLFAGTGTVGFAALLEGASSVTFIEGAAKLAGEIRRRLPEGSACLCARLPRALEQLQGTFDVILSDPPYGCAEGPACLLLLAPLLSPAGRVAVEHHHKDDYPDAGGGLVLERRRRFGETALSYYRHPG